MHTRTRLPAGTELVVALAVCATRRSDQARLYLNAGDRLVVDSDFQGLLHGRVLSGTRTAIAFVHGDLARMTHTDGRAIVQGGASQTLPAPAPMPGAEPAPYQPPPLISTEAGYLKGRQLLSFCDMPR